MRLWILCLAAVLVEGLHIPNIYFFNPATNYD